MAMCLKSQTRADSAGLLLYLVDWWLAATKIAAQKSGVLPIIRGHRYGRNISRSRNRTGTPRSRGILEVADAMSGAMKERSNDVTMSLHKDRGITYNGLCIWVRGSNLGEPFQK